jgi:aryl-alcohol dehydrogenase-like predicted oxidoreductase
MEFTALGKTNLRVSVAGLGCGGSSRLGQASGRTESESVAIVRQAIERGVNFLDTAAAYGTEAIVGAALRGRPRDSVVISTKAQVVRGGEVVPATAVVASLDRSLGLLGTDHVDVFHLHGVPPAVYEAVRERIVPALLKERERGKLRHLGVTETPPNDPEHLMLQEAVHDPVWEVVMVAFHMMNQNARASVFPHTQRRGIGTLAMFAVRSLFSVPGRLQATMATLADEGRVPPWLAESDDPLGFLIRDGGARSVIDAAYRYVRHEPGIDVVLFGTGDAGHLESNIESILAPPLPAEDVARLDEVFGGLRGIGLDRPSHQGSPPRR